jgi:hypothetical protein
MTGEARCPAVADERRQAGIYKLPIEPIRPEVSAGWVNVSCEGAEGRGPVGDELQALMAKEAIATTTNVRWRRDMGELR